MKPRLAEKQQHRLDSISEPKVGKANIGEDMHGGGVESENLLLKKKL